MSSTGAAVAKSHNSGILEIITTVQSPSEARALPRGSVVGDTHGGVTFSDTVAEVLERRSSRGWREIVIGDTSWTVIELNR
ncbi:MAG TPA: hypothetical protein VLX58_19130 [Bryobacteraceae bacterium]|nr:hypothetical protein [Bryobacteraceae bacterium]